MGLNLNLFWNFFALFFCYAVRSCVYDHSHPYLVSECLFLAENKAFPYPRRVRAHLQRVSAILWDAAATCSVVISAVVVVAAKKRSPNLSVSWLTIYGLVDLLPVSAGSFRRALQRHFSVDFQTKDISGNIFSCSKRACFAFVNRVRNGWTALARNLPTHRFHKLIEDWGRSAASEALQRHLSIDFQNQDTIGKIFSCSKRACFAFVNRTRNGLTASARNLPKHRFCDWLKTEAALKFNLLAGYPKYERHALHSRHWLGESMKRSVEVENVFFYFIFNVVKARKIPSFACVV